MNEWNPRENPLVQRAFRVGFRKGQGSFRLGWYLVGLAVATMGPFIPRAFSNTWGLPDAAGWMLRGLLILLGVILVIGGFQRMLVAFSQERERGTFEFLHLSTLRSSSIVLGFLMAGQLPGYLALVLLSPLLVICALLSDFPISTLLALLLSLVFFALALSVFFLYFGFWAKKSSEFRGSALVYVTLLSVFGNLVARLFVTGGIFPAGVPQTMLGSPVIMNLYTSGTFSGAGGLGLAPTFFGIALPQWILGVVLLTPPMVLVFLALCRALRHRDAHPWSTRHAVPLFAWGCLGLVGVWWGTSIPFQTRAVTLAICSWIMMRRLADRDTPDRPTTVQALGRLGGDVRQLLREDEGPPIRLSILLLGAWVVASTAVAFEADRVGESGALLWGVTPALFILPLLAVGLLGQWLSWQAPRCRWVLHLVVILAVAGPFLVYLFGDDLAWLPLISAKMLQAYGALSPLSQLLLLAPVEESVEAVGSWALLGQIPYGIAAALLFAANRASLTDLAARSRMLLEGLGAPKKPVVLESA